jgi:hypothetical protein
MPEPPVLGPNFANTNPANINTLNVNNNAVNELLFEPLETGNIMYRASGTPNSVNLAHYVKIKNAAGRNTNIRKYMKNTRKNPHTRENVNFTNKSRLRRIRKGAATLKKRQRPNGNGNGSLAKRPRLNE